MDIGDAIKAARNGFKVYRHGWNGKGNYVYLHNGAFRDAAGDVFEQALVFHSTVTGQNYAGWVPSTSDVLATDWDKVIEP